MFRSQTDEQLAAKWDPEPFTVDGWRSTGRDRTPSAVGGYVFEPRPEYARPPVNPILVKLREYLPPRSLRERANEVLIALDLDTFNLCTPEQTDHARKVLTRLAALS